MVAGDVTLTRGVGYRDDELDANVTQQNAGTVSGVSVSSDGDILTWSGTFTNPVAIDGAIVYRSVGSLSSSTYGFNLARAKITALSGNFIVTAYTHFTDSTAQVNTVTIIGNVPTTGYVVATTTEVAGKTIDRLGFIVEALTTQTGTFNFTILLDFIYLFKETLTLPAVSQPLQLPLLRRVADLQIPSREGSVLQDLGSPSPQIEVGGTLITTATPNNYTGDQWWDVLVGTWLEANWQWFASDRISYKYQITELSNTQNPGRVGYYDFRLRLKKVDIVTATAQTFNSNTGTGAIQ
jgi:hypothetical protein